MGSCFTKVDPPEAPQLEIRNPILLPKPCNPQSPEQKLQILSNRIEYAVLKEDARLLLELFQQRKVLEEMIAKCPPLTENGKSNAESESSGQQGTGLARDSGPHLRRIEEEGSDEDTQGPHCQQEKACAGQEGSVDAKEGGFRGEEGDIQAF